MANKDSNFQLTFAENLRKDSNLANYRSVNIESISNIESEKD